MLWAVGPVTFVSLDPDAWIYPLVYPLLDEQYAWLESALKTIDRSVTPWVVFLCVGGACSALPRAPSPPPSLTRWLPPHALHQRTPPP